MDVIPVAPKVRRRRSTLVDRNSSMHLGLERSFSLRSYEQMQKGARSWHNSVLNVLKASPTYTFLLATWPARDRATT